MRHKGLTVIKGLYPFFPARELASKEGETEYTGLSKAHIWGMSLNGCIAGPDTMVQHMRRVYV